MPVRTGLPQHIVDQIIGELPEDDRTTGNINVAIDEYFNSHRLRQKRLRASNLDLVALYTKEHLTLREIAAKVGISASGIAKRLGKLGIKSEDGEWVTRRCGFCGLGLKVRRGRARQTERSFCNVHCAGAFHSVEGSYEWRHGTRLARVIVARYFQLERQHVVDHRDGNEANNDVANLRVYASQSDHLKMHHGRDVKPLWDGAALKLKPQRSEQVFDGGI